MDVASMTEGELEAVQTKATGEINDAYWAFTRCARGKPPSMVVPESYRARRLASEELRRRRRS